MLARTIARATSPAARVSFRPAITRQLARRNYMVGLQPGVEEQQLTREASTYESQAKRILLTGSAVEMIFGYFGLMGGACAVGSLGGAIKANREVLHAI